ncbi:MAG: hypothetical protein ACW987_16390 [Candidatus Thorarchaeota archaeon]
MSTLRELELQQVAPRLLDLLRRQGLTTLSDFQSLAVDQRIMRGNSQLLVTYDYNEAYLVGEIALLNRVASDHRARAVVLCPNPYQAGRRYQSLSHQCSRLGIEATQIIRRREATKDTTVGRVIVTTYTSFDLATRVNPEIFDGIVYVLIDRLDLIGQSGIGASLETVLVTLLGRSDVQYVAICPPLEDIDELGDWLNAEQVHDPKADVKVIFSVKAVEDSRESIADLTQFVQYRQGQVMILCANISTSEELALELAGIQQGTAVLDLQLSPEHKDDLIYLAEDVRNKYPQCKTTTDLGKTVSRGVAFFHEGVGMTQRRVISTAWEEGVLPVMVMPTRFAIASGLRASVVFLMGVFMQEFGMEISQDEAVTMLSEWQLSDVLEAAGRRRIDNEAFGIVVVDSETEKTRVIAKFFETDPDGNLQPRLGEVDSVMDETENVQDLVLRQLCGKTDGEDDPFSIIERTLWGSASRVTDLSQTEAQDEAAVDSRLAMRSTRSTFSRAKEIPDTSVKVVSVRPDKIEGLVHSGSREIWHYATLRSKDGVSCSCESWKYQGIRKHRLCKHLVKFARYAMDNEDSKPYAAGVILQALRGLEVYGELETDKLIVRDNEVTRCTDLRAISDEKSDLKKILRSVLLARKTLPKDVVKRVLDKLPAKNLEEIICEEDMPGIIENCLEELEYVNSILLKLLGSKHTAKKESKKLNTNLVMLLESMK